MKTVNQLKRFTNLFSQLDQTTRTNVKVAALAEYFENAPPQDAAWALYFLSGEKLKRSIPTRLLREWSAEHSGIESWLFDECYEIVGDLAETMALILPAATNKSDLSLHDWVTKRLVPLKTQDEQIQKNKVKQYWNELDQPECFIFHKLITGGFRVGVSKRLVIKGLSQASGIDAEIIAHRLMGNWEPAADSFTRLLNADVRDAEISRPYPFYLAHPLEKEIETLGSVDEWTAEWKWDGIRAQLLRRENQVFIWSRGEDLMTDRFPELTSVAEQLPNGTVIDGEIVACRDSRILPFSEMQRRIGRKKLGPKILADVPVALIAFDLLELDGIDIRDQEHSWRQVKLNEIVQSIADQPQPGVIRLSNQLTFDDWDELAQLRSKSRDYQTEGVMLKHREGPYRVGRQRGQWWKWKIEPYTVDAVLTYAQRGHGKRASLYTDYTFGVWNGEQLVTFAKAFSGLTDAEIRQVDQFVRSNTIEKFGPVRSVKPELVFELAFENIQHSSRHKSGIAVRFPRISRWRHDLKIDDADTLDSIKSMMPQISSPKK